MTDNKPSEKKEQASAGWLGTDIGVYRLLSFFSGLGLIALIPFYPADAQDPLALRITLVALAMMAALLSFVWPWARRNIVLIGNILFYLFSGWAFFGVYANHFQPEYVLTSYVVSVLTSIAIRDRKPLVIYNSFLLIAALLVTLAGREAPHMSPGLYFGAFAVMLGFTAITNAFRHQASNSLLSRKEFLTLVLNETPDAILVVDSKTQLILDYNKKAEIILRAKGESALSDQFIRHLASGLPLSQVTPDASGNTSRKEISREIEVKLSDNHNVWLAVAVKPVQLADKTQWLVRLTDITRDVVTRQELIRSHYILNKLDHLILVCDKDARITYISPSVQHILGFEPGMLLGDGWWKQDFGRQGDVEKMKQYARECATGVREVNSEPYEQEYRDKNGAQQWILWKDATPGDGTIIGVGYLYTQMRRNDQMRRIIFNIAEAVSHVQSLTDLYAIIHHEVTSLIKARNFYIALETGDGGIFSPYFIDQERPGSILPESGGIIPRESISGHTMRTGLSVRYKEADIRALQDAGALVNYGPMPKMWMGAPLRNDDKVFGLIALVDYENDSAFSGADEELLSFVANQIGSVVTRFQQQEKLRVSEERYRLISEAAFEGFALSENMIVREANQAYAQLFGYTREELVNLPVQKLVDETSWEIVRQQVEARKENLYSFTAKRKDGSTFEAEALGRRLMLEGREVRLVAIRDITERKRTEALMQAARFDARFKAFVNHSAEMISIVSANGEIQYMSPSVQKILGYDPEELSGVSFITLVDEENVRQVRDSFNSTLASPGATAQVGFSIRHKDGSTRFVESVYTNLLHDPFIAGILVSSRDLTERSEFEKTLRQSEERFKSLFAQSPDAIFVEDEFGNILDVNDAACKLHGRERGEMIGINVVELVPPDMRDQIKHNYTDWMDGNITKVDSFSYTKDGRAIPVEVRSAVISYGEKRAIVFLVRDISERIETSKKIEKSLALLSATYESTQDGILVLGTQGETLSYNEGFLRMWHVDKDLVESGGRAAVFRHMSNETDPSSDLAGVLSMLESQQEDKSQAVIYLRDGRVLQIYARSLGEGSTTGILWFFHDITELKKVERALRSSERRSKALLDAIPDLMYRVRIDGLLLDSKSSSTYTGGGSARYEAGRDIRDILPAEAANDILDLVQESIASGEVHEMEYSAPVGNTLIDFDVRIVRSGTDEALVIERDVTRRKETERELIRRNFELDSFVYRSSHDLKAPLNSIMGLIGIIQSESEDPVVGKYIKLMNKSVLKLDAFIRDLTDFSRNERQELARVPVSFANLVQDSIENLKFMENADRVNIEQDIHSDAVFYSDPMRVDIILNNLISNAVKYQNLQAEQSWVKIGIAVDEKEALLTVADNGIGIKAEHQGKMFELFFRASLQAYGSGLGLYIVKNTVEKLNGEISLQSEYGKGTVFTVRIPNPGPANV